MARSMATQQNWTGNVSHLIDADAVMAHAPFLQHEVRRRDLSRHVFLTLRDHGV